MPIVPKYVQIYNQILKKIENAEYSRQIPSEMQLAKDFNCSRVTIRSALALLKEDKIIYSIKGEGNFINRTKSLTSTGIEVNCSLFPSSCSVSIDKAEIAMKKNDGTAYSKKVFGNTDSFSSFNVWFEHDDRIIGNEFSIITASAIPQNLNHHDHSALAKFLNHDIYQEATHIQINMQQSLRKANTFHKKFFTNDETMILIEENLNDKHGQTFVQNKYYLPLKYLLIKLNKYGTK